MFWHRNLPVGLCKNRSLPLFESYNDKPLLVQLQKSRLTRLVKRLFCRLFLLEKYLLRHFVRSKVTGLFSGKSQAGGFCQIGAQKYKAGHICELRSYPTTKGSLRNHAVTSSIRLSGCFILKSNLRRIWRPSASTATWHK